MTFTPELVASISACLLGLGSLYQSFRNAKTGARKDQLILAEEKLAEQNERILKLERKLDKEVLYRVRLMGYIGELQRIMRAAGLQVPPEPLFEDIVDGASGGAQ